MQQFTEFWRRLAFFLRLGRFHGDLSPEMREHLEEKLDELLASGMPREEARFEAQRQFGSALLLREESRDVWRGS